MKKKVRRLFLRLLIAISQPVLKAGDWASKYYIKRWEIDKAFGIGYHMANIQTCIELAEEELRS